MVILEADFVNLISYSSDDEIDPSTYQYISSLPIFMPHMMMQRRLSEIAIRRVGEVINDNGPYEFEDEKEEP